MICLSDNDILLHLSGWNLLTEFQAFLRDSLKTPLTEVYVMNAFTACLRTADTQPGRQYGGWLDQYGKSSLDRALRFCESVKQVYELPYDRSVVAAFQDVDEIDEGEAILIAVAHRHPGSIILTNEWRFLGALATSDECAFYHSALQNRVVHLRQVILAILDEKGNRYIQERVKLQPQSDGIIVRAFKRDAAGARVAIQDAISEVDRIGKGLLYSPTP